MKREVLKRKEKIRKVIINEERDGKFLDEISICVNRLVVLCFSYSYDSKDQEKDKTNYTNSGDFKLPDSNDCMIVATVLATSWEWSF